MVAVLRKVYGGLWYRRKLRGTREASNGGRVRVRIISRGLDAPTKFAPTLKVRKGNARYRRG